MNDPQTWQIAKQHFCCNFSCVPLLFFSPHDEAETKLEGKTDDKNPAEVSQQQTIAPGVSANVRHQVDLIRNGCGRGWKIKEYRRNQRIWNILSPALPNKSLPLLRHT